MNVPYRIGKTAAHDHAVDLTAEDRRRHVYIAGKTGTGKSTLLYNLISADLESGRGFALIDPHGDLAEAVADAVPPARTGDVVYFDPLDADYAVGFNPLSRVAPAERPIAAARLVSAFKHIWADSWGPRLEYILMNAVRLLLDNPGSSLLDLPLLLTDDRLRARLLRKCADPVVAFFWRQEFAGYGDRLRAEAIAPLQNKVGQFAANPMLRAVVGQPSTFNVAAAMNGGKVLIANLAKRMGEEPSHLLGAFLVTAFAQAAEGRAQIPEASRRDFTLYVDEFQNFATDAFASILSEARKWRLNLVVANQFLGQLPDALRQAVLGNVGTLIVFRVGSEDASLLGAELDLANPRALTNTPNYQAWLKRASGDVPGSAALVRTIPAVRQTGRLAAIRARTWASHARPRAEVLRNAERAYHRRIGPRSPPA